MLEPAISSTYMLQYSIVDMNQLACWPMIKLKPEKNRFLSTTTYKLPLPVHYILAAVFEANLGCHAPLRVSSSTGCEQKTFGDKWYQANDSCHATNTVEAMKETLHTNSNPG